MIVDALQLNEFDFFGFVFFLLHYKLSPYLAFFSFLGTLHVELVIKISCKVIVVKEVPIFLKDKQIIW